MDGPVYDWLVAHYAIGYDYPLVVIGFYHRVAQGQILYLAVSPRKSTRSPTR
jgi:hypothetical protein